MDRLPVRQAANRFPSSRHALFAVSLLAAATVVGCEGEGQAPAPKPPEVDVSNPIADKVADFEVFTGRTQTPNYVEFKAHVTGHLEQVNFQEGDDVTEGQLLFKIDSRLYDSALAEATAKVNQAASHLQSMQDVYARDLRSPSATPEATLIQDRDNVDEAKAAEEQAKAARLTAQHNVDYCVIHAPFSARIGRRNIDPHNDVIADNTVLATLVQLDPLYAYFDVDERTLLRIGALLPQGKIPSDAAARFPLTLGLANERPEEFKHKGMLKIADNKLDSTTGTLRMWGTFDNADHELKPGLFVRVRMDVGPPEPALFIAESALGKDQGRDYVYVVNAGNQVVYTQVEEGPKKDGLIAVKPLKGYALTDKDRIIINGLQRIHPVVDDKGNQLPMEVKPTVKPMPRAAAPAAETPVVQGQDSGPGKKG